MTKITIQNLLEAGVHFGHQTKRWNPKMKPYIHGTRNGIYIFDLIKTMHQLEHACKFVYDLVSEGEEILFVGTKRQAQEIIRQIAEETNMHFVSERWLGGTLTNIKTIRSSISKMEQIRAMEESGELDTRPKKEASSLRRNLTKLERNLSGIVNLKKNPKAVVIVDILYEHTAVREACRLNLPIIGIVDTNSNPENVAYVIPGNDDAHRSIKILLEALKNTILAAQAVYSKKKEEEQKQREAEEMANAKAAEESKNADKLAKAKSSKKNDKEKSGEGKSKESSVKESAETPKKKENNSGKKNTTTAKSIKKAKEDPIIVEKAGKSEAATETKAETSEIETDSVENKDDK